MTFIILAYLYMFICTFFASATIDNRTGKDPGYIVIWGLVCATLWPFIPGAWLMLRLMEGD